MLLVACVALNEAALASLLESEAEEAEGSLAAGHNFGQVHAKIVRLLAMTTRTAQITDEAGTLLI